MYDAVKDNQPLVAEDRNIEPDTSLIEFSTSAVAVMEDVGTLQVSVLRLGKVSDEVSVKIDTIDGSANEGEDYVGIHDVFTFAPGQAEIEITVEIVDDDDWEPDEEFFLKIALNPDCDSKVKIGMRHIMTIMILNDDEPGTFGFDKRGHFVKVRTVQVVPQLLLLL